VLTFFVGLVIIGGIKRIGAFTEKLVPFMIAFYFLGALIIIIAKFTQIPAAFLLIFQSAFGFKPVVGALVGIGIQQAMSQGVSKGVLSNESGLGSAAIAQAAAKSDDPSKNGLLAMTGTFIDTIVVNTLTTLSIVLTGAYKLTEAWGEGTLTSTALTAHAFDAVVPLGWVIPIASFLFGYSTLLAWCYYGEQCFKYLVGVQVAKWYRWVFLALLFIGALLQGKYLTIVWYIGDTFNAFMALPNLIALILLAKFVSRFTKDYFTDSDSALLRLREGEYTAKYRKNDS
jgi:AGCS family alanine or glycine:cation symporter